MATLCLINFPEFSESKEFLKIGRSEVCVWGGVLKVGLLNCPYLYVCILFKMGCKYLDDILCPMIYIQIIDILAVWIDTMPVTSFCASWNLPQFLESIFIHEIITWKDQKLLWILKNVKILIFFRNFSRTFTNIWKIFSQSCIIILKYSKRFNDLFQRITQFYRFLALTKFIEKNLFYNLPW